MKKWRIFGQNGRRKRWCGGWFGWGGGGGGGGGGGDGYIGGC